MPAVPWASPSGCTIQTGSRVLGGILPQKEDCTKSLTAHRVPRNRKCHDKTALMQRDLAVSHWIQFCSAAKRRQASPNITQLSGRAMQQMQRRLGRLMFRVGLGRSEA